MAREDPQFRIRLPAELKARVEEEAVRAGRSLNAEIVHRLKATLNEAEYIWRCERAEQAQAELIAKLMLQGRTPDNFPLADLSREDQKLVVDLMLRLMKRPSKTKS